MYDVITKQIVEEYMYLCKNNIYYNNKETTI